MISPAILACAPSGGSAPYHADAVHFNGVGISLFTGSLTCTDNYFGGFSFWVKFTAQAGFPSVWYVNPIDILVSQLGIDQIPADPITGYELSIADGTTYVTSNETFAGSTGTWVNYIGAWNTNHPTGSKIVKLLINGVDAMTTPDDFGAGAFVPAFNGQQFYIGDDTFGDALTMDLADFRFFPGTDFLAGGSSVPQGVIDCFIANGKPVNPSVATAFLGTAGAVLFSGDASAFPTNQGTGGSFSLTGGPLTNASTSPSD